MAYTRTKKTELKTSLSYFIKGLSDNLTEQIKARNAEDEANFNKAVLEGNISLDAQLAYREEQLKRGIDIPEEKNRIKGEISNLKQRIEQKTFSDAYTVQLQNLSSGAMSIDSVITWLETQKAATKNQTVIDSIDKQLIDAKEKKFTNTVNLISNQTEFAIKDKSERILNEQISKVDAEKSKALLAGDKTLASNFDLQLQSLKKAVTEIRIENITRDLTVSSLTGAHSSVDLLDSYNQKIKEATSNSPVTVGGQTFANERDYWTFARDSYIADQGSQGFLSRLSKEVDTEIAVNNSKNLLNSSTLEKSVAIFSKVAARNELQGYETIINNYKQASLQTGADAVAENITTQYSNDYNLNKAINNFQILKDLGVNVDKSISNAISFNANLKQSMAADLLEKTIKIMQVNPNLTPDDAINQALTSGAAGTITSPNEYAQSSTKDIVNKTIKTAQTNTGMEDSRLTVKPTPTPTPKVNTPTTPTTTPAVQPTTTQAPKSNTYTIQSGDTLSKLAAKNNTTVAKLMELNPQITDANMIIAGQQLNIAPAQTAVVTPTQQPTQQTQQQPSGGGSSTSTQPKVTTNQTTTTTPKTTTTTTTQPKTTTTTPKAPTVYQGPSIVDYLNSVGKDSSYSARAKIAKNYGITNYTGSSSQNTQLLRQLRGF